MEREAWCEGCGVTLQTVDPDKPGYVPASALERENVICRRCFRIRHYNEIATVEHDSDAYLSLLAEIAKTKALVVQVVDLFDIAGSWIPGIHRHIGGNPLLILANKVDLFPQSVKRQRLKEWVDRMAKELGVKPVDVVLTSAAKGFRLREVADAIERYRDGEDVFIVGTANVGKSTLINRLVQRFGAGDDAVTTSPYPGTTLDAISIPLEGGQRIVDMPGIIRKDRISEWIPPRELSAAIPDSEVKPKVYQLNEGQTLFFGGLARFDFVTGPKQPFVCYAANSLYIHRTKREKADEMWERHRGGLLSPPSDPSLLPPMKRHTFHLKGETKQDLVVSGLGWVTTGSQKSIVDVWAPEGVQVHLRPAII
ncbi:ribosome biogenesis GTPase YqeH [Paludifilum halophilum]|uniref:Ribosome biogenesis GTPase YqeH n=1 Tax=Paludifilum halophilum TaxID=1642702 RepID=A0A235B6I2_9BACL|nr:ribosome biogenesis GTPase YqeH [Paludifilum halophilum]